MSRQWDQSFHLEPVKVTPSYVSDEMDWATLFDLVPFGSRGYPQGWVILRVSMGDGRAVRSKPRLYWDSGAGFNEMDSRLVAVPHAGQIYDILPLPTGVKGLRLAFSAKEVSDISGVKFQRVGKSEALARLLLPFLHLSYQDPKAFLSASKGLAKACNTHGLQAAKNLISSRWYELSIDSHLSTYRHWYETYDVLGSQDEQAIQRHIESFAHKPVISVLIPTYNTPEHWLKKAIESVRAQTYTHWELCIADDASTMPHVRAVLKHYAQLDPRIKVVYRERNGHISAASNSALEIATGEFIALLDHDDELAPHALYMVASEIASHPEAELIFSDEDKINEQAQRFDPYFKPDWNPDLFLSQNMITHLGVYRREKVLAIGGFRLGFEGSQDYDMALRFTETIKAHAIRHIPFILYHWRAIPGSTALGASEKSYAAEAAKRAVQEHLQRLHMDAEVETLPGGTFQRIRYRLPSPLPKVSIIIPTRDGYEILRRCIDSILKKTTYTNFEILVIDNQSQDPETLSYLKQLVSKGQARVVSYDQPFNYSAINNFAVTQAEGDVLCLLNNDTEVISPDWLNEMVSHAMRPEIGAVGAKLYYSDDRIQHAGVVCLGGGIIGHAHKYFNRKADGYFKRAALTQNYTAVTGACLVVRKALFEQLGGLEDQALKIAFNDVDFCFRLHRAGYHNVWTPFAELYHHESVSRGLEDTPEKQNRLNQELAYLYTHWSDIIEHDPAYNPNLTAGREDFSLAWPPRARRPWAEFLPQESPAGDDQPAKA